MKRVLEIWHVDFDGPKGDQAIARFESLLRESMGASLAAARNAGLPEKDISDLAVHLNGFRFMAKVSKDV